MSRNTKKNTMALPRSFSKTTMTMATPHMSRSGNSDRMSGRWNGPMRTVNTDSSSRFSAR